MIAVSLKLVVARKMRYSCGIGYGGDSGDSYDKGDGDGDFDYTDGSLGRK